MIKDIVEENEAKLMRELKARCAAYGVELDYNNGDIVYIIFKQSDTEQRKYKLQIPPFSEITKQVRLKRDTLGISDTIMSIGLANLIPENNHSPSISDSNYPNTLARKREMLNLWPDIFFAFLWPQGYL